MCHQGPERDEKKSRAEKVVEEIMAEKVPKCSERHTFTDSKDWANFNHDKPPPKPKRRHTSETESKETFENIKSEMILYLQKQNSLNYHRFLIRNHRNWKEVAHFSSAEKRNKRKQNC